MHHRRRDAGLADGRVPLAIAARGGDRVGASAADEDDSRRDG